MKILLLNPPWISGGRHGVRAGSRWPHLKILEEERYMPFPFYLAYATALLKKNGYDAKAIDAIAEGMNYDSFKEKVIGFSPDLIFSEVSTPSMEHDMNLLKELKEKTGAKLVVAGPDTNITSQAFLGNRTFVDYAFSGEYEFTLLELLDALKSKKSLESIEGLTFRSNKKIAKNIGRKLLKDINTLPWPERSDLPLYRYHDCPGGIPEPSVQMWASRGCPYSCIFCAWPQIMYNGHDYRTRDIKDTVDEIEYLVKEKGFKSYYFDDDTFNIGKKRMMDFALELKKRNLNIPWAFMGRADLSDKETLVMLKSSGLSAVKYGMESGVQALVDNAKKNLNLKKAVENIEITKELGIKVHLTFTFGLPGETKETIKQTLALVRNLNPDSVQFSITTPFPGTKFYENMNNSGNITSYNWEEYDGNTRSVIKTENLSSEDLKEAQVQAYKFWKEFKLLNQRYSKLSPFRLFQLSVKENGLSYTVGKTLNYLKAKNYRYYLNGSQKQNRIIV